MADTTIEDPPRTMAPETDAADTRTATGAGGWLAAAVFAVGAVAFLLGGAPVIAAALAVVAIVAAVAAVWSGSIRNPILSAGTAATEIALAIAAAARGDWASAYLHLKAIDPMGLLWLAVLVVAAVFAFRYYRKRTR